MGQQVEESVRPTHQNVEIYYQALPFLLCAQREQSVLINPKGERWQILVLWLNNTSAFATRVHYPLSITTSANSAPSARSLLRMQTVFYPVLMTGARL